MLKINNVWKSYKDNTVLRGVNLKINKGEIKGLIGVNGAGKSTLIELVCGVKQIDEGQIFIDDISVNSKNKKLKYMFGYMPQIFCLFNDLTVEENLGYLCAVYGLDEKKEIERILSLCNLASMRNKLASNLSGGYKQLLSLASCLMHSPKLLILDEPTSAMDPIFRKNFWKIIKEYKKMGGTVFVITHFMEELLECDNFACLSKGKVVFEKDSSGLKSLNDLDIEKILIKYEKDKA